MSNHPLVIDETGNQYGGLHVLHRDPTDYGDEQAHWVCICACGNLTSVRGGKLRNGRSTRCRRHSPKDIEKLTDEERVLRRTKVTDSCWLWVGATNGEGYGCITIHNESLMTHRVMYEALVGPIPDGLFIDHLCRVHNCVNPEHLEPVTHGENVRRGYEARRVGAAG